MIKHQASSKALIIVQIPKNKVDEVKSLDAILAIIPDFKHSTM